MNGTIELKPCPFCGSPARMTVYGTDYLAECTFCDASACTGDTEERAAAVWNNRADAKYELGQFDERAYRHGRMVVDEMRNAIGIDAGVAHFVCVAVYVDGYLQFAGADACLELHGKGKVEVVPAHREDTTGKNGNLWDGKFGEMVDALIAINQRVLTAKASRKYTRDEVLAMLDEIDPGEKGGAE